MEFCFRVYRRSGTAIVPCFAGKIFIFLEKLPRAKYVRGCLSKAFQNKGLAGFLRPQESSENPIGWIHAPENGISHGKGVDAFAGNESRFVSNASKSGLPLSQQPAPRIKPVRGRHFRDLSQDRWAASSGLQRAAAFLRRTAAFRKSPNPSNHIYGRRLQTRKARSSAASVYSPLTTVRRSKTVPSPGQLTSQSRPRSARAPAFDEIAVAGGGCAGGVVSRKGAAVIAGEYTGQDAALPGSFGRSRRWGICAGESSFPAACRLARIWPARAQLSPDPQTRSLLHLRQTRQPCHCLSAFGDAYSHFS